MKKLLVISSLLFLLFIVTACNTTGTTINNTTGTTATDTGNQNTLRDGVYTAEGTKRQYGYEVAVVTVTEGRIADINLKRMTAAGAEVNYDDWTGTQTETGWKPNLKQFRLDMAQQMLQAQSADVDVIATATDSSLGWMEAVEKALDQARG